MCDGFVLLRELQNHLSQTRHLTTLAGEWMPQYAHAWLGTIMGSSAALPGFGGAMPSPGTLARLWASSSSSKTSVTLSSSSWRLRERVKSSVGAMIDRSSATSALIVAAESEIRWFPKWVKSEPSMFGRKRGSERRMSACVARP